MTPTDLADELTYAAYSRNRLEFPEIDPARFRGLFAKADEYERRFRAEQQYTIRRTLATLPPTGGSVIPF